MQRGRYHLLIIYGVLMLFIQNSLSSVLKFFWFSSVGTSGHLLYLQLCWHLSSLVGFLNLEEPFLVLEAFNSGWAEVDGRHLSPEQVGDTELRRWQTGREVPRAS